MPKHYRKKHRKRRKRNRQRSSVRIPGLIMPDTAYVKLRYNNEYRFESTLDNHRFVFVGNGVYDPDLTLSTARPGGFDQWMAFYDSYEVIGSRITLKCTNMIARPFIITLIPKNFNSSTGINSILEQRYSKYRIMGVPNNSNSTETLSSYMKTRKIIGRQDNSINFLGNITNNPSHAWYWQIEIEGMETAVPPAINLKLVLRVTITFDVKFSNRNLVKDLP